MFQNNSIIITNNKKQVIKNNQALLNIKIYTPSEFKKIFYFDFSKETIYYICDKYKVIPEIAEIYLDNLYNISANKYNNNKLRFLCSLKEELIANNLLKTNKLFKSNLRHKKVVIYNINPSKELDNLINELNNITSVEVVNDNKNYKHIIYEFKTIEDEVTYVASNICALVDNSKLINNIYLTNLSGDYRKLIKKIFPMFNLPVTLEEDNSIFGTFICTKFIEYYEEDLNNTINKIKEFVTNKESENIMDIIINIINQYSFIDNKMNVKELIIHDLKNTKLPTKNIINSVHEVSLDDNHFTENDIVFLMSFNQGIIPTIYKDELYLTDNDKKELSISMTVDKNNHSRMQSIERIKSIPNLIITYKTNAFGEEYNISNINEELKYPIDKPEITYDYSNLYNKITLASLLDEYYRYGTKNDNLTLLNNTYNNIPYNTYDNRFTGIDNNLLKEYLNNSLTLSYSTIDTFFKCPFSFYLGTILKLNIFEQTFQQFVGTLFHSILEKRNNKTPFDEIWDQEINRIDYELNPQELFLLKKLKEELRFIIKVIDNQENFTNLHDELHEQRVYTNIANKENMKISFTGVIDKIKYKEYNDYTILSIIDYKTGNPHLELSTLPYGINLQLPIYLYLIN